MKMRPQSLDRNFWPQLRFPGKTLILTMLFCVGTLIGGLWLSFRYFPQLDWVSENGLLENFQMTVLAISVILFVGRAGFAPIAERLNCWGLAVLTLAFLLRETDLRPLIDLQSVPLLTLLSNDNAKLMILIQQLSTAVLVIIYLLYLGLHKADWPALWNLHFALFHWPWIVAGCFLLLGSVFEDHHTWFLNETIGLLFHWPVYWNLLVSLHHWPIMATGLYLLVGSMLEVPYMLFWEEALELVGYCIIFIIAVTYLFPQKPDRRIPVE